MQLKTSLQRYLDRLKATNPTDPAAVYASRVAAENYQLLPPTRATGRQQANMRILWSVLPAVAFCLGCAENAQTCWPSSHARPKRPLETRDSSMLRIRLEGCSNSGRDRSFPGALRVTIENVSLDFIWINYALGGAWLEIAPDPPNGRTIPECHFADTDWRRTPPTYFSLGQQGAISLWAFAECQRSLPREGRFRVVMHYRDPRTDGPPANYDTGAREFEPEFGRALWFTGELVSNPIDVTVPPSSAHRDCGP